AKSGAYNNPFNWDFLAAAGSLVLYAAPIAFLLMRLLGARVNFLAVYGRTVRQLALPIVTIAFILGIAYLMNFSGMTSSLAIAFSKTGFIFPFVAAFLGWLGVFLTGSDTSSNTLFGPLQAQTAQQLGNVSPILTAATNSSGGVMGKMISPQNLSVGAAGVNRAGAAAAMPRRRATLAHISRTRQAGSCSPASTGPSAAGCHAYRSARAAHTRVQYSWPRASISPRRSSDAACGPPIQLIDGQRGSSYDVPPTSSSTHQRATAASPILRESSSTRSRGDRVISDGFGSSTLVCNLMLAQTVQYQRGAESGSRTRTSLRTSVFETDASACSATSALPERVSTIPLAGAHGSRPDLDLDRDRMW